MMKETPPTLTLEATTFNKPQLQEQLSVLEQRQEAQIALAGRSNSQAFMPETGLSTR